MPPHPKLPDFDTLMKMFQQDPDAFETFRKQLLADAVAECPLQHKERVQKTLMRIEKARQAATTPLDALVFASRLMRDSLKELNDALHRLQYELADLQSLLVLDRIKNRSQGIQPPQIRDEKKYGA